MLLLYAALAYFIGLGAAAWWWQVTAYDYPLPAWLWLLPLLLLPFVHLLDRLQKPRPIPPMRWPQKAGFEPPQQGTKPSLMAVIGLCFATGVLRYGGLPPVHSWTPADLAYYNLPADQAFDRQAPAVTVTGWVNNYPVTVDGSQDLLVAVAWIQQEATTGEPPSTALPVQGSVRVTAGGPRLHYGQQMTVRGRLSEPAIFDDFSYKEYLARQGIGSVLYNGEVQVIDGAPVGNPIMRILYTVRSKGEALINRSLPEPYAALANGMLLGIKAGIPADLYEQFNITGTSHVIVISGANVALISGVIVAVAARLLGKRRALWPTLAAIACYALLVGGDPSVLRAAVMGGLFVTATAINRRSTALVSLAAACLAMTLVNPLALWDVGLQMSCMGTAGLVLLGPVFVKGLRNLFGRSPAALRIVGEDVVAVTLAASLATLPLVLYYFGRLSLVSLPANLLITQVQPLILLGGSAALVAGVAGWEWLSQLLLWLAWFGLRWTVAAVQWWASLPLAALNIGGFGLPHLALAYTLLGVVIWHRPLWAMSGQWMDRVHMSFGATAHAAVSSPSTPRPFFPHAGVRHLASPPILLSAAVVAALLWAAVLTQPDGRLHVWFLDVGQGDGILIQTPSGRQVLIDGGPSGQALLDELGAVMPFWDRDLDLVVLTHPDADHMTAQVEAAGRFTIGAAWESVASAVHPQSAAWSAAVEAAGAEVQLQHSGGWADLGDGVALWVLGPPAQEFKGEDADNENSLVTKLVYGDFSALLTGDAGVLAEQVMLTGDTPLPSTVLKVAHHGSKFSTGEPFVAAINPMLTIIQVGENRYGHPDSGVLERLAERTVLRTDKNGRIEVTSDGRQMWVKTGRQ